MTAAHWGEKYIGLPWVNGAQGPNSFDCWGFVRYVYSQEKGVDLPVFEIDADKPLAIRHAISDERARSRWVPVDFLSLEPFDVLLLSQANHPDHVGVWSGSGLLHCIREAGVVHQTRQSLYRAGWNIVSCYRKAAG